MFVSSHSEKLWVWSGYVWKRGTGVQGYRRDMIRPYHRAERWRRDGIDGIKWEQMRPDLCAGRTTGHVSLCIVKITYYMCWSCSTAS